jgi:hypothetical protein
MSFTGLFGKVLCPAAGTTVASASNKEIDEAITAGPRLQDTSATMMSSTADIVVLARPQSLSSSNEAQTTNLHSPQVRRAAHETGWLPC